MQSPSPSSPTVTLTAQSKLLHFLADTPPALQGRVSMTFGFAHGNRDMGIPYQTNQNRAPAINARPDLRNEPLYGAHFWSASREQVMLCAGPEICYVSDRSPLASTWRRHAKLKLLESDGVAVVNTNSWRTWKLRDGEKERNNVAVVRVPTQSPTVWHRKFPSQQFPELCLTRRVTDSKEQDEARRERKYGAGVGPFVHALDSKCRLPDLIPVV